MDDEDLGGGDPPKSGGWIMTFADLMSLLMCFFVLLLSFAEMDVQKFKRLAGSMKAAFGVQNQLNVPDIPKGTSIIAQEFSPGTPDPTPLNQIWQKTADLTESSLEVACQDLGSSNSGEKGDAQKLVVMDKIKDLVGETENDAMEIAEALRTEISDGAIEVETIGRQIIIRIKEQGSFGPGSATLTPEFEPVLDKVHAILGDTEGQISVEGHTDSIPIRTAHFRSNWALSSARAVAVTHGLLERGGLADGRFVAVGHGDTRPLAANDSPEGRARNRRVEITIRQGGDAEVMEQYEALRDQDPVAARDLRRELAEQFRITPEDIF